MRYMPIRPNKRVFTLFALLGFIIGLVTLQLTINWIQFLAILYQKPDLGYHELPSILHYAEWTLPWIKWVILAIVVVIDARKRDFIRTGSYALGLIVAVVVSFVIFVLSFGNTMADF